MNEYLYLALGLGTFLLGETTFLLCETQGKPMCTSFWIGEFPLMTPHEHFIMKGLVG